MFAILELKSYTNTLAFSDGFLSWSRRAGSNVVDALTVSIISLSKSDDLLTISTVSMSEVSFNIELISVTDLEIMSYTSR
jgi:hypothetical protein